MLVRRHDRHNDEVRGRAKPRLPTALEVAADVLGNRLRVAVLRSLVTEGPATRSELGRRLKFTPSSLLIHLDLLEQHRLVRVDPPRTEPGRLMRRYTVDAARLSDLTEAVARELRP